MPENSLISDSEIIDEKDDYIPLIFDYASITNEEWQPSNIKVTGALDGKLKASANNNGKSTAWDFEQDGSKYVNEVLVNKISSFSSRNLPGTFIHMPMRTTLKSKTI